MKQYLVTLHEILTRVLAPDFDLHTNNRYTHLLAGSHTVRYTVGDKTTYSNVSFEAKFIRRHSQTPLMVCVDANERTFDHIRYAVDREAVSTVLAAVKAALRAEVMVKLTAIRTDPDYRPPSPVFEGMSPAARQLVAQALCADWKQDGDVVTLQVPSALAQEARSILGVAQ